MFFSENHNNRNNRNDISIAAQLRAERERERAERLAAYEARRERLMFSLKQSMLKDDYEYRNMRWDEED